MNEPTLPAIIIDIKVGANSKIIDCLVAKPIKDFGINGFSRFSAVCMDITPPTKKDINATIPKELMMRSSISFIINSFITELFVWLLKTFPNIKK